MFKRVYGRVLAATALVLGSSAAMAGGGGTDFSGLTDAINFDGVESGVMTAAGALVAIYVIIKGIRLIISFAKG